LMGLTLSNLPQQVSTLIERALATGQQILTTR